MSNTENTILPPNLVNPQDQNQRTTKTIIYRSEAMQSVLGMAERVAPSDAAVMVLGESGTGKDSST